ncbi:MAG: DUF2927 domain-containing protein [Marinosulfonomonas sp.]|nr:DUF2927 domain-containing protein [Marinosulfonomonas sp.]
MLRTLIAPFLLAIAACGPLTQSADVARRAPSNISLPEMHAFRARPAAPTRRSNASIAQQFLTLAFDLESGRHLPVLSRFEGPITLRLTGAPLSAVSQRDLDQLLARLRNEARISITRVAADQSANITIEVLKRASLQRAVPQAACFVAPRVTNWAQFRASRRSAALDWTTITEREKMAIFLPGDVSPQEVRDCLHEEIAQALGPVNDLYHLSDSIFNDDDFHAVLTGFDMTILRAFYSPSLHSGMTRQQVAARLPAILSRINPAGRAGGFTSASATPLAWGKSVHNALGPRGTPVTRLSAAKSTVAMARAHGWQDNRLGFALYAQGRLALGNDPDLALASFSEAESIFRTDPTTALHAAHVAVQGAAYALSAGRAKDAIAIADRNTTVALRAENASLLATFLMLKAQALDNLDRPGEADIVRLDSLGWARYGFRSEGEIRSRLREIAALTPARKTNTERNSQ